MGLRVPLNSLDVIIETRRRVSEWLVLRTEDGKEGRGQRLNSGRPDGSSFDIASGSFRGCVRQANDRGARLESQFLLSLDTCHPVLGVNCLRLALSIVAGRIIQLRPTTFQLCGAKPRSFT